MLFYSIVQKHLRNKNTVRRTPSATVARPPASPIFPLNAIHYVYDVVSWKIGSLYNISLYICDQQHIDDWKYKTIFGIKYSAKLNIPIFKTHFQPFARFWKKTVIIKFAHFNTCLSTFFKGAIVTPAIYKWSTFLVFSHFQTLAWSLVVTRQVSLSSRTVLQQTFYWLLLKTIGVSYNLITSKWKQIK